MKKTLIAGVLMLTLACAGGVPSDEGQDSGASPLLSSVEGISVETLLDEIEVLASDEFEGRGPGSEGEQKTIAYFKTNLFSLVRCQATLTERGFRMSR